ncbi:MAG: MarR family transcriptional regulator [Methanopyri archaeon]|nr:MarR family transcriptional regulator [Methanopyri archaeon]
MSVEDLTYREKLVLLALYEVFDGGPAGVKKLAPVVHMDKTKVSRALNALEEKGLVEFEHMEGRRLTEKGEELAEEVATEMELPKDEGPYVCSDCGRRYKHLRLKCAVCGGEIEVDKDHPKAAKAEWNLERARMGLL